MRQNTAKRLGVSVMVGVLSTVASQADLVRNPTQFGANLDVGQIIAGEIWEKGERKGRADGQMLTRTGVYLTESAVLDERLSMAVTFGGIFWIPLPELTSSPQDRRVQFGPGVGQAQATYAFGEDPSDPSATLQFGLFSHKYSESVNLGEYLFRSGAYPGYLQTGGWSYLNSASYLAQGIRLSVPMLDGMLNHDLTMYMERGIEPTRDISPGYMLGARPTSFLRLYAGGVWAHGISLQPKNSLTPRKNDNAINNAYSKSTGLPVKNEPAQSLCRTQIDNDQERTDCGYYTFKGFKVVGGASVDLGVLLAPDVMAPGDFKLYAELALLGVKDYPHYYDDKMERMPIMAGINVPTFGIFDRLSFETEYRRTRFPNTIGSAYQDQLPHPVGSQESPYLYTEKKTYWKWTAYARRTLIDGVSVYAQFANDHMRHYATLFADPHHRPATERNSDWYYIMRLEFGI